MYPTPIRTPAHELVETADSPVVLEAIEIVKQAVDAAASNARLAAERCGCRSCRARATETLLWALAMQHRQLVAGEPAASPLAARAA